MLDSIYESAGYFVTFLPQLSTNTVYTEVLKPQDNYPGGKVHQVIHNILDIKDLSNILFDCKYT